MIMMMMMVRNFYIQEGEKFFPKVKQQQQQPVTYLRLQAIKNF
jgi:hypothetical protein